MPRSAIPVNQPLLAAARKPTASGFEHRFVRIIDRLPLDQHAKSLDILYNRDASGHRLEIERARGVGYVGRNTAFTNRAGERI